MLNPLKFLDQRTSNCLKFATLLHGAIIVVVSTAQFDLGSLVAGDQETIEFTALDAGSVQLPKAPIVHHVPTEIQSPALPLEEAPAKTDDVAIVTKPKPKKVASKAKKKAIALPKALPEKKSPPPAPETETLEESPVEITKNQKDLDKDLDEDLEALEASAEMEAKIAEEQKLQEQKEQLEQEKAKLALEKKKIEEEERQARIQAAALALEKEKVEAAQERAQIAAHKAALAKAKQENALAAKINNSIQYGNKTGNSATTVTGLRSYLTLKQKPGNKLPSYPAVAQRKGIQGTVVFKYFVEKDGHIRSVHIVKTSGQKILDDSAYSAIKNYQFYAGQPGWTEHAVSFQLKGQAVEAPTRLRTQLLK